MEQKTTTWERLEEQIKYYDDHAISAKRWFKVLKVLEIISAAIIPLAAGFALPAWFVACLGALVVVLEGVQHLFQFQHNWISYRSTCEALRHEKHLFIASAGPYGEIEAPEKLLAERIESLISTEHTKWVSSQKSCLDKKQPSAPLA